MKCPRCNGLMIHERFQDVIELFFGWRCVICGEVFDDAVWQNRKKEKDGGTKRKNAIRNQ